MGGPDGCAIDFETSASGTEIKEYVQKATEEVSLFGHDTMSKHLDQ